MKAPKTDRQFELIIFTDSFGARCSLQQSLIVGDGKDAVSNPGSSCVWLGVEYSRMHLNRKQVKKLVKRLLNWLDHNSFGS